MMVMMIDDDDGDDDDDDDGDDDDDDDDDDDIFYSSGSKRHKRTTLARSDSWGCCQYGRGRLQCLQNDKCLNYSSHILPLGQLFKTS